MRKIFTGLQYLLALSLLVSCTASSAVTQDDFDALQNDYTALQKEHSALQDQYDQLQLEYTELQERDPQAEADAEFQAQLDDANKQIQDLTAQLEESSSQIQTLTAQLEDANGQVQDLTTQLNIAQEAQAKAEEALEQAKKQSSSSNSGGSGSSKTTTSNSNSESGVEMVWVSKTGKKYHSSSTCSNMKNPSQISLSSAKARGLTACSKCY